MSDGGKGLQIINDQIVVDGEIVTCPYCQEPARASLVRWEDVEMSNMIENDDGTLELVEGGLPSGVAIMVHTCKALT
jgi:hypothetical protein